MGSNEFLDIKRHPNYPGPMGTLDEWSEWKSFLTRKVQSEGIAEEIAFAEKIILGLYNSQG